MIKEIVSYHPYYIKIGEFMENIYKSKRGIAELFDIPLKTLNNDLTEMRRNKKISRIHFKAFS